MIPPEYEEYSLICEPPPPLTLHPDACSHHSVDVLQGRRISASESGAGDPPGVRGVQAAAWHDRLLQQRDGCVFRPRRFSERAKRLKMSHTAVLVAVVVVVDSTAQ